MIGVRLATSDYPAGDMFAAADIMTLFPLTTMQPVASRDLAPSPGIRADLRRIGERPASRRAMAEADPGFAPLLS